MFNTLAGKKPDEAGGLFVSHQAWLLGWLHKRLGNSFDAADLSQDTWVRVLASGKLPLPDEARAHLRQVAQGLAIDLHRRRILEAEYLQALSLQPEAMHPSAQEQAIIIESLLQLDAALARLPAKAREVLLLARFDGLTYSQIAIQMNLSIASVRKYMFKALLACRSQLQD